METYNDDYTKEEDLMMWELHEIRKAMADKGIKIDDINKDAEEILKKYGMENLLSKEPRLSGNG
jgi:hypothetical protein